MGKINLARVDERLIHGQVMITLSQRSGVNSIFVVDDVVANDKFMKDLYKSAGSRTGQKTIVMSTEKAKYYWDEFHFKEYSAIVICKTVNVIYELVKYGIPLTELNLGGIAKKNPDDKQVTKSVYMNIEDAKKLKELRDDFGVENIYFQATPSSEKTSLTSVLSMFNL
ncbi:PTS mannose/fructose/sorbose transporter subunit IIB [Aerococcus agrisoli]|uniref:PTS mannose/fructose/sorbose transporter subunit IIB n=1 Tax=Aerococcus agrisoli TaxID=2487350 RepID=A0A3N4GLH5_9LACT|nr:PTS sugar transporter subunit IIB [Aerococcus agrisoli]RPA63692.1 PTS mannose/fructose/sorbose transporter subunit IIB [Aerococcus agrisoli]